MFLRAGIQCVVASSSSSSSSAAISSRSVAGMILSGVQPATCTVSTCSSSNISSLVTFQSNGKEQVYSHKSLDHDHCQPRDCPDVYNDTDRSSSIRPTAKWETSPLTSYHHFQLEPFLHKYHPHYYFLPTTSISKPVGRYHLSSSLVTKYSSSIRSFSSSSSSKDDDDSSKSNEGGCLPPPTVVTIKHGLETREAATDFLNQLSDHQKQLIYHTLNIEILRDKYEGHLGSSRLESHHYLSKFGRPATAKEDPTGTLCEVSPKWLHARLDEKAIPASAAAIWAVAVKNALPFIGFGFLDNLIMILAGDYIDITIGAALGISTMAAAALGNAISDVAGIGSAWYVEEFASKIGIKDPVLTPYQMASGAVRWAMNLGRAFGVLIGCLLGMFPLLFLPTAEEVKDRRPAKRKPQGEEKEEKDKEDKGKFS